jgi:hypothetical protein
MSQAASEAMTEAASASGTGGLITTRMFWAGYGVAMAAMGTLPAWSWPPNAGQVVELIFNVLVFAVLALPYVGRPVLESMRLHHIALVHRNTLLVALFVVLVASARPPAWAAGIDALLLAGYLLLIDALTLPPAVLRRTASPVFLLGLAALVGGATALVALPASSGVYRPVLVAAAGAAAFGAALATAFGSAGERRVGSRRTERQNQDRSSE